MSKESGLTSSLDSKVRKVYTTLLITFRSLIAWVTFGFVVTSVEEKSLCILLFMVLLSLDMLFIAATNFFRVQLLQARVNEDTISLFQHVGDKLNEGDEEV